MNETTDLNVPPEVLRGFIAEVFQAHGMPDKDAAIVAEMMVEADLHGCDAHGVFRLAGYITRLKAGGFNRTPNIRVDREHGGLARVDGDDAMGHLVVRRCVDEAIERARIHGISCVGCHRSNHAGAAGTWVMRAVSEGMIGIYMAVGNANLMAPWGGADLLLSTNPIAIAVPGGEGGPVLLDMATSNTAFGTVKMAAQRGETMPGDWMIDANGEPLTDPNRIAGGSLLPIGGAKGYGLALMIGLLAGTMNGAAMGSNVVDFNKDHTTSTNTGQTLIVINPASLGGVAAFRTEVDRIREEIITSRTRPGFDSIRLPGDRALHSRIERARTGVPCPAILLDTTAKIAAEAGVASITDRI
ncbi:malate/lactate dehydrogenase [Hoeflea sp. IMCC20628]|uniref:Ldh family oxidoreductase n=1 Tax=Hoeflea sp. IMCC20628 TaxID=1620421 RepID=UPI00063A9F71|nr:Ldh family oxidoreductase [Hoeflea sp. IMCC20628]AKH98902.1 malate/lactate dehydrogenase [Hoeflea sp. IMCC20628]